MTVLWDAERADGDFNAVVADVEMRPETLPLKIKAYDFYTNTSIVVPFELHGKRVVLKNFTIPDHPIALHLY